MKKRLAAKLVVVSGSTLGWSRPTDRFLLDKQECFGPFANEAEAIAASQRPRGSFGTAT